MKLSGCEIKLVYICMKVTSLAGESTVPFLGPVQYLQVSKALVLLLFYNLKLQ